MLIIVMVYTIFCALVPATYQVKRTIHFPANDKMVYNTIRKPITMSHWAILSSNDENIKIDGVLGSLQSTLTHNGNTWTLIKLEPASQLKYQVDLKKESSIHNITFDIDQFNAETVKLTLTAQGYHSFFLRFFNLRMDASINNMLEEYLQQIAKISASNQQQF